MFPSLEGIAMTRLGGFLLFRRLSDWPPFGGGSSPSCDAIRAGIRQKKLQGCGTLVDKISPHWCSVSDTSLFLLHAAALLPQAPGAGWAGLRSDGVETRKFSAVL